MINLNNYQEYAIDYLDGTLSAELEAKLLLFFAEHPELKAEFDELTEDGMATTPAALNSSAPFDPSQLLKPDSIPADRDHMLAQYLEGQLSPEAGAEVFRKIGADPAWAQAWEYMQLTRLEAEQNALPGTLPLLVPDALTAEQNTWLTAADAPAKKGEASEVTLLRTHVLQPDLGLVYPHKRALKHTIVLPLLVRWGAAVAAVAILVIGIAPFLSNDQSPALAAIQRSSTSFTLDYPAAASPQASSGNTGAQEAYTSAAGHTRPDQGSGSTNLPTTPVETTNSFAFAHVLKPGPLSYKTDPAGLAFAFEYPEPAYSGHTPTTQTYSYTPASELVTNKLKHKLWGGADYPEEDYVMALVEKTSAKIVNKKGRVELEREEKVSKRRAFRLRIGAFELVRSRR